MGVLAWLCDAAYDRAISSGEPLHPSRFLEGRELYRRIGDRRGAVVQAGNHVLMLAGLGAVDEALATLPAYEREGAEIGFHNAKLGAAWARASCAAAVGDLEPFLLLLPKMRAMMPVGRMSAGVGLALAELLVLRDRVDEAAEEVALGLRSAANVPLYYGGLLAVSAMVKLRRSDLEGALADSEKSMEYAARATTLGSPYIASLARFEVLQAAARREDEAKAVLRAAANLLVRRAARLGEYGPGYLERGWRNAELMSLVRAHGVSSDHD